LVTQGKIILRIIFSGKTRSRKIRSGNLRSGKTHTPARRMSVHEITFDDQILDFFSLEIQGFTSSFCEFWYRFSPFCEPVLHWGTKRTPGIGHGSMTFLDAFAHKSYLQNDQ